MNPILNPGFDAQSPPALGNNLGYIPTDWNSSVPAASNNLIRTDGITNYNGGPNSAHSGANYYDASAEIAFIWQAFTLVNPVEDITFSAQFSAREAGGTYPRVSSVSIWSSNNWSGTTPIATASQSFVVGESDGAGGIDAAWKEASATIASLAAGTYYVRIDLHNYTNVDSISFTGTEVPEPGGAIAGFLLGAGLLHRSRRKL